MTITEASWKWKISTYRIRELIKSGQIPAKMNTDSPVPFYDIPDDFKFVRGKPGYPAGRPRTPKVETTTKKAAAKAAPKRHRSPGAARKKVASDKR